MSNKRTMDEIREAARPRYLDAYKMREEGSLLREIGEKYCVCKERARVMVENGRRIKLEKETLKLGRDYEFVSCYLVVQ